MSHASCFDSDSIGIEMVGEFNDEPFDSGPGALVRDNAIYLMALLHKKPRLDRRELHNGGDRVNLFLSLLRLFGDRRD